MTFKRQLESQVLQALKRSPAVALLGPQQVGKTTLAMAVGEATRTLTPPHYLDLESEADRAKLGQPEVYPGDVAWPMADDVMVVPLRDLMSDLARDAGDRRL